MPRKLPFDYIFHEKKEILDTVLIGKQCISEIVCELLERCDLDIPSDEFMTVDLLYDIGDQDGDPAGLLFQMIVDNLNQKLYFLKDVDASLNHKIMDKSFDTFLDCFRDGYFKKTDLVMDTCIETLWSIAKNRVSDYSDCVDMVRVGNRLFS